MNLKKSSKAVIFDMDGVIVDSMPYHYIAWYEALRPYGIRVTAYDAYTREGEMWQKTLADLFGREGLRLDKNIMKDIFDSRQKVFKKYFKRHIFKGAFEFISCLKGKGYALGLVTGTPLSEVKKILPKKELSTFGAAVTGAMVKKGKTHPEPYLTAAKLLKVRAKDCAVIENAPLGIRAAKAAGMKCFAVTTSLPGQYLKGADIIVDKLEDVMTKISPVCK